jgi:DNA-binding NarL/FixJ family response regulator
MTHIIKILIVDDQRLFREGLRTLLSIQPDFEIIGEAANGEESLRLAAKSHPMVVLMDLRMPVLDGVAATRRLRAQMPDCRVIVLTTYDEDEDVFEALRAGAVGYLLKDVSPDKLYEAIRTAARGEYYLLPSITSKVVSEFSRISKPSPVPPEVASIGLSTREIEILRLVATGSSNKEIAEMLVIAEGTVKNHLTSILSKLGANDRLNAVIKAREHGLI